MQYMNNIFSNVRGLYSSINSTPNSGAIDVIVVEQPDGTLKSTPLRVVFGMLRVIKPKHKPIDFRVNEVPIGLNLYLGDFGEVYCSDFPQSDLSSSLSTNSLELDHQSDLTEKVQPLFIDDITGQEDDHETYLGEDNPDPPEEIQTDSVPVQGLRMSLCGDLDTLDSSLALSRFNSFLVSYEDFVNSPNSILNNKRLVFMFEDKLYTWHSIGPMLVSLSVFASPLSLAKMESFNCYPPKSKRSHPLNWIFWSAKNKNNWKTRSAIFLSDFTESSASDHSSDNEAPRGNFSESSRPFEKLSVLTSDQIKLLNLRPGLNIATFSVTTSLQGTCTISCRIFLWHYTDKLVVSDIDGTITKTDVLGQVLPMVGMTWCHDHVIKMFRAIEDNRYRIIYLSSRSIAQSAITTQFIQSVRQDGHLLPKGPIMLSPFGFFQAFNREVILKCPQEFKISCLKEIVDLFNEENCSPIVGGFGNRDTDETTYRALGVSRIFIINSKGKVVIPNMVKLSTRYSTMKDQINAFFPYCNRNDCNEEYMNPMYWRLPYRTTQ